MAGQLKQDYIDVGAVSAPGEWGSTPWVHVPCDPCRGSDGRIRQRPTSKKITGDMDGSHA